MVGLRSLVSGHAKERSSTDTYDLVSKHKK